MCKNRKYWERKNNVGSWREKFWRASLHGNTLCAGWGKYGHFRTLFWTSYANVHREMEGCTWEIFVIFRYENHQFHFLLKKKKKEITALHRPEDQREVEKGSWSLWHFTKRHTHETGWSEARMDLSYVNQRPLSH